MGLVERLRKNPPKMRLFYRMRGFTPKGWKFFLSRNLFGLVDPATDKKFVRIIDHNRLILTARYLRGSGIEVGALFRPLAVPDGVKVKHLDRFDHDGLYTNFPEQVGNTIQRPDIVDDAETMATVADESQDFLIANHVMEHLPNPLLFLKNAVRVVKKGGILYIALPDKNETFDSDRPITTFEHLMEDYKNTPAASRMAHYEEFVRLADWYNARQAWKTEEEYRAQVKKISDEDYSIHYHVWDRWAMMDFFMKAKEAFNLPIYPESVVATKSDVVFILRRQ